MLALSGDLDTKMKEARDAKENVLNRRMSVKEFYNQYPDFDEFKSNADKRIKKDALQDLKDRLRVPPPGRFRMGPPSDPRTRPRRPGSAFRGPRR